MPYPVLMAVGAALSAAGTGASLAAAEQSKKAIANVRSAEAERQKGYQSDAQALLQKNITESDATAAQTDLAAGESQRQNTYQQLQGQSLGAQLPSMTGGNRLVKGEAARSADFSNAWTKAGNTARAKLGAYGDWGTKQVTRTARGNQSLAAVSRNARGSADILGAEAEQASHKGDTLANVGQGLSMAGSIAGAAGAGGYGGAIGGASAPISQGATVTAGQMGPTIANLEPLSVSGPAGYGYAAYGDVNPWLVAPQYLPPGY